MTATPPRSLASTVASWTEFRTAFRNAVRAALKVVIAAIALAATGDASAAPAPDRQAADQKVLHLLNRIAYGPRPGDVQRVEAMGIDRYIDEQLHPERIAESPELTRRLQSLTTLQMSPARLFDRYEPHPILGRRPTAEQAKAIREQIGRAHV